MARKTNKTAHVLNLISKSKESHQTQDDDYQIDTIENIATNDLSFMELQLSNDKEISEQIKENLSKLVSKEVSDADEIINTEKIDENISDETEQKKVLNENYTVEVKDHNKLNDILGSFTSIDKYKDSIEMSEDKNYSKDVQDYLYVNVLEEIVKNKVDEFIQTFDVCTCPRCKADIIALSLNGLTPKYIVVDKSHVSPLLNFFSAKYKGSVAAQLSKACIIVKENPHH